MKKSLIALAALSAFATAAQAQSSVTVYGLLDQSYVSTDSNALADNAVTKATNSGGDGQLSGSRLGFRGTEDLGGGLKANFVLEFGLSGSEALNGINNGTRLGFVELQSNTLGSVRAGRQVSPTKAVNDIYTTFANSTWNVGSVTGGTDTADSTNFFHTGNAGDRVSNAITYLTPVVAGFQAQIQMAKDTSKVDGVETTRAAADSSSTADRIAAQPNNNNFGVSYTAGNLSVMFGRAEQDSVASNVKTKTEHDALGASYKLGAATLFATYNIKSVSSVGITTSDREDTTVGINYTLGKWDLKAAYGEGTDVTIVAGTGVRTERSLKGYQVGAVYNLSKRTNAYVAYGDSETKTTGSALTATRDGYIAGVRHSF